MNSGTFYAFVAIAALVLTKVLRDWWGRCRSRARYVRSCNPFKSYERATLVRARFRQGDFMVWDWWWVPARVAKNPAQGMVKSLSSEIWAPMTELRESRLPSALEFLAQELVMHGVRHFPRHRTIPVWSGS